MLTITKSEDGQLHLELRGDRGLMTATVDVEARADGIEVAFTFDGGQVSALVPRPSAKLFRDKLSEALDARP